MGFVAICTALYDYAPQSEAELEFSEGELLYILDKSGGDSWWKAKKKAADDEDEEPEGLIPINYVQDANPTAAAKALYDYSRQTEEEVSFEEEAVLDVYDESDPDWTLVGVNDEFGFAPANYIEITPGGPRPRLPTPSSPGASARAPAANLAAVMGGGATAAAPTRVIPQQPTPEPSDEEQDDDEGPKPFLPTRPASQPYSHPLTASFVEEESGGIQSSPPHNRAVSSKYDEGTRVRVKGGFRLYSVSEMASVMGRRRKMPTTFGLDIANGVMTLMPEGSDNKQEWDADKCTHYSMEGKHVFIELVRPSRSLDLHAGSKGAAEEIMSVLGEIMGASRAEGIKEVIAAAGGATQRKGVALYDFMAQGDDEVTVAAGDEVIILDDSKSEEWWNVRRIKNGAEGVMPSSYVEVTGEVAADTPRSTNRSVVEQNRREEERLTREAARANRAREEAEAARIPERASSLGDEDTRRSSRKKSSKVDTKGKSKPDASKVRTWTDHSGTFKVDAQFVGLADGKIHLHKVNGVRIAVPVSKMSPTDLAYVESLKRKDDESPKPASRSAPTSSGAAVDNSAAASGKEPEYDWFDFFLSAGVNPHQCERYAQAMIRDSMDESVLSEITQGTLRTLGLKEGDALKVMKYLDQKFNRMRSTGETVNGDGGLFTGPGGELRNNTSRGRPEVSRQASDVVDAKAFAAKDEKGPATPAKTESGFENDATWTVQQPKQQAAPPKPEPAPPRPAPALVDLSVLHDPLQPTVAQTTGASQAGTAAQTGATPSFFDAIAQQKQKAALAPPPRPTSAPGPQQYGVSPLQAQMTGVSRNAALQAPPGQSMDELTAMRMQQYTQYLMSQPTGYGYGMMPQPTGFPQQAYLNGNVAGSPFADPRLMPQQTGYQPGMPAGSIVPILQPQKTGFGPVNGYGGFQPQPTGFQPMQAQPTGYGQYGIQKGNNFQSPAPLSMPQQQSVAPLMPQKTGPAPPVRFGVEGRKLTPQPTGRRANLSAATAQNPFGF